MRLRSSRSLEIPLNNKKFKMIVTIIKSGHEDKIRFFRDTLNLLQDYLHLHQIFHLLFIGFLLGFPNVVFKFCIFPRQFRFRKWILDNWVPSQCFFEAFYKKSCPVYCCLTKLISKLYKACIKTFNIQRGGRSSIDEYGALEANLKYAKVIHIYVNKDHTEEFVTIRGITNSIAIIGTFQLQNILKYNHTFTQQHVFYLFPS